MSLIQITPTKRGLIIKHTFHDTWNTYVASMKAQPLDPKFNLPISGTYPEEVIRPPTPTSASCSVPTGSKIFVTSYIHFPLNEICAMFE